MVGRYLDAGDTKLRYVISTHREAGNIGKVYCTDAGLKLCSLSRILQEYIICKILLGEMTAGPKKMGKN